MSESMRLIVTSLSAIALMYLAFVAAFFFGEWLRRRRAKKVRDGIETGAFTDDRDGAEYKTVEIGGVTWLAENLNYDAPGSWLYGGVGGGGKGGGYGRLYTWDAARSACPEGWRLPSLREWVGLFEAFGGASMAGKNLKSPSGWKGSGGGYDMSGCAFPPGGLRLADGRFAGAGESGIWWSSDTDDVGAAFYAEFSRKSNGAGVAAWDNGNAFSVRCVLDVPSMPPSVFFPWGQPDYDK